MCGITGVFNPKGISNSIAEATKASVLALKHRGPDHQDQFATTTCCLGHARLSIIDPDPSSHQPMHGKDHPGVIVFNGEIFNYIELRSELERKGISFKTHSDTEVVLNGLFHFGVSFLNRLNGFFALAWFNKETQTLLLARDRFGEKPLLWSVQNETLFFASEMDALLRFPIERTLNPDALWYYFRLSYVPAPHTLLNNIHKLEPGCFIEMNSGKFRKEKWYVSERKKGHHSPQEYEEELKFLLEKAVKRRLISDRPIGSFLSGGIDSCIVSGLAAKEDSGLHTYSISFPDYPQFNEETAINANAKHLKTQHTTIAVSKTDLDSAIDPVLNALSEPFADSSSVPTWILCRETSKKWTVALSGDGADELFGGYNKHRAFLRASKKGFTNSILQTAHPLLGPFAGNRKSIISKIKRYAEGLSLDPKSRYFEWACFGDEPESDLGLTATAGINRNLLIENASASIKTGTPEEMINNDIHLVLANDMLHKVDQMSMAHALEVRSPFLDHEVVEFAQSLPIAMKLDMHTGKKILRRTFAHLIPEENTRLAKRGFEVPLAEWVGGSLRKRISEEWLSNEFIQQQQLFRPEKIQGLLKNPQQNATRIWMLIVFQHWYKRYFH